MHGIVAPLLTMMRGVGQGIMKATVISIFAALLFCGCMCRTSPEGGTWRAEDVAGSTFTLISQTKYAQYHFLSNGLVVATVGMVNGPLTAPIWKWKITEDGSLSIQDEGRTMDSWRVTSWTGGHVIVESDTGTNTFQTTRD